MKYARHDDRWKSEPTPELRYQALMASLTDEQKRLMARLSRWRRRWMEKAVEDN